MHDRYCGAMTVRKPILILCSLLVLGGMTAPASAQSFAHGDDQKQARRAMLDGEVMPFSIIKRRVERAMGDATLLGVAPPPRDGIYLMQFLHANGVVEWVYVDGKSGDIVARKRQKGQRD